jgi:hypothetical protein
LVDSVLILEALFMKQFCLEGAVFVGEFDFRVLLAHVMVVVEVSLAS